MAYFYEVTRCSVDVMRERNSWWMWYQQELVQEHSKVNGTAACSMKTPVLRWDVFDSLLRSVLGASMVSARRSSTHLVSAQLIAMSFWLSLAPSGPSERFKPIHVTWAGGGTAPALSLGPARTVGWSSAGLIARHVAIGSGIGLEQALVSPVYRLQ
ncbi:hypothetical protein U9M48_028660, partial [Paspalum notatum var. saurae]